MQRPGPLMPLPLDQFLLPPPNPKSSKRPHSPGALSPAKRRILNEEGLFSPRKTPLPRDLGLPSPGRFSTVLAGPASPARVLDFGLPRSGGDPQKRASSSLAASYQAPSSSPASSTGLAPSPELKPRSSTRGARAGGPDSARDSQAALDPFDFDSLPSPSASPTAPSFTLVPRELPPPIDPRSVHYPGFAVYQDPHTVVFSPGPASDASSPDDMDVDPDECKENQPPRRRLRKAVTDPIAKADLFSPSGTPMKKSHSIQDTPRNKGSLTPQNTIHRGMRQLMKDELDLGEGYPDGHL